MRLTHHDGQLTVTHEEGKVAFCRYCHPSPLVIHIEADSGTGPRFQEPPIVVHESLTTRT